jgi:type IV secretory pathway VirB2 component (pilin)
VNTGLYSVRVSNSLGTATSVAARLRLVAWGDIDGTYQALLLHDNSAAPAESPYPGRFTVTLSTAGAMTGKLEYRGLTYAFSGRFTPELDYQRTIVRTGQPSLQLQMHLDADSFKLTTQVSEMLPAPAAYESGAVLPLHTVHTAKAPAAQMGRYTARLNPPVNVATGPTAGGYAMVNIVASGAVTITGKLPDGTALSSGALLRDDASIAWYNPLYPAKFPRAGYFAGPVTFNRAGGDQAVAGPLDWRKPAQLTGLWSAGFSQSLTVEGSTYIAPLTGQRALTLQDAAGTLECSLDGALYATPVHLSTKNLFTVDLPNPSKLSLTTTRLTGAVTGRFYDPVTKKYRTLGGVVLQAQGECSGFYSTENHAAEWWVAPH